MNLSKRQEEILFAIIEEYAEIATPVGSVTLAKLFNVSSATIRAEMARLEEYGYIAQPHTSAGRVPTDSGYRYYVNALAEQPERVSDVEQLRGNNEDKPLERSNRVLEVRISSQERADFAIRGAVDSLVELTGNLGLATIGDQLYMSGIARLFTQPEFLDNQRVQAVAKLLDNLEPWLREAAPGQPLNIFIGQENPIGKTSQVSLIISRFRSPYSKDDGKEFGVYINRHNLSFDSTIEESIFETNPLLMNKKNIELIEYASFFGSNEIIKYIEINGEVELTSSIWRFAIHSENAELIKYLEDKQISPPFDNYETILLESIKCHHNDVSNHIIRDLIEEEN